MGHVVKGQRIHSVTEGGVIMPPGVSMPHGEPHGEESWGRFEKLEATIGGVTNVPIVKLHAGAELKFKVYGVWTHVTGYKAVKFSNYGLALLLDWGPGVVAPGPPIHAPRGCYTGGISEDATPPAEDTWEWRWFRTEGPFGYRQAYAVPTFSGALSLQITCSAIKEGSLGVTGETTADYEAVLAGLAGEEAAKAEIDKAGILVKVETTTE